MPRPPTSRRVVPVTFDLKHIDGRIFVTGTDHGAPANLSRAEVLALVKFAAELWPDQVYRIAADAAKVADGDECIVCGRQLGDHTAELARKCASAMDAGAVR
jgi:hypothetical protein